MKKIITFLGLYPRKTEYAHQHEVYEGQVFAEALHQFLDYDQMLVFVTEKAHQNAFPVLSALGDERIVPILIPNGENTEEMWQIFEALTEAVDEGDTVIFDITHGLRSLPFLVFLAAAFLKSAKEVTIEEVYYGAYELQKDAEGNPRPAPVIELSEFVGLLDWLNASDQFIKSGNAASLAELLRHARPHYTITKKDKVAKKQGTQLSHAARALEDTSRALRLILPDQAMQASEALQGILGATAIAVKRWARPFTVLARRVTNAYAPLALDNPRAPENLYASLNRERQLVEWYVERSQLVQAVAVAREWIVTWGLVSAGFPDPYDKDIRLGIEDSFGYANRQRQKRRGEFDPQSYATGVELKKIDSIVEALDLYQQLADLRNTLLHAGKRRSQTAAKSLEKQVVKLCQRLNELPIPEKREKAS